MNYYNEKDPYAAEWLRNLVLEGLIAPGEVDERSIEDVTYNDIREFTQCHFFAGIGCWSYALRLAGWPDDRPVWTGSCPCQPFSAAGKAGGFADERHLWPAWFHLIEIARPSVIFGEQVASKDGLAWLDLVQTDLEGACYAIGANDLSAAGVGAPHIRQRLYFVAHTHIGVGGQGRAIHGRRHSRSNANTRSGLGGGVVPSVVADSLCERRERRQDSGRSTGQDATVGSEGVSDVERSRDAGKLADAERRAAESQRHDVGAATRGVEGPAQERQWLWDDDRTGGDTGGVADDDQTGRSVERRDGLLDGEWTALGSDTDRRGPDGVVGDDDDSRLEGRRDAGGGRGNQRTPWTPSDFVWCRDGKWRPTQPGLFPLAHGIANRVGRLRAYGNAIVAPLAAEFIEAYLDVTECS